jgi:hypothetical protein
MEEGMTVDEAIPALTQARERLGGNAPLVMADGLGVRLKACVTDCCVYATDQGEGLFDDLRPAGSGMAG